MTETAEKRLACRVKPFLKWAGGKSQLLQEIHKRLPDKLDQGRYYEPFLGGGAVFFSLFPLLGAPWAILADLNAELINCFKQVRDNLLFVIPHLTRLRRDTSREAYLRIRKLYGKGTPVQRASRFIYLNKIGYNGLHRVNRMGGFNVPYGRYENPSVFDAEHLRDCAAALRFADLVAADFEQALNASEKGDFAYCDPPYDPVSATANFTAFTPGGFGRAEQCRLAGCLDRMHGRGVRWLLSNADTPFIRDLYKGRAIEMAPARRSINSDPDGRGRVGELLIRNY